MEKVTNRDADYLRASVPLSLKLMLPDSGGLGCLSTARYEAFSGWMVEHNLIAQKPDLKTLIDNSYLPTTCN